MNQLKNFLDRFKSKYVGTVTAQTYIIDEAGNKTGVTYRGRWILTTGPFNKRKAKLIGHGGYSDFAINQRTRVTAWLLGGPLPQLDSDTQLETKPRAKAPVIRLVTNRNDAS